METIGERAINYAYKDWVLDDVDVKMNAYETGATEQKAIDIETACKACENELRRLRRLIDDSVGIPATLMSVEESLSRIRMEMISSTEE